MRLEEVLLIPYGLQPLVGSAFLYIFMVGQVLHPAVGGGSMPVLHSFRNLNNGARNKLHGRFAPFLIPASASDADQHLNLFVMYVPVVSAARFESYIGQATVQLSQIAVP